MHGNPLIVGLRSALFHLASVAVTLVFIPFLPLLWISVPLSWQVLRVYIRLQLALLWGICGQRFELEGAAAEGPVILASRHEALWETLVLPLLFDNPVVFLKQEILSYPVAGPVVRKLGYIGLDRSGSADRAREAFALARARAAEGRSFLIFPNGTRNPLHRDRVQKGVAVLYRALKLPCVPIVLNSGTFWPYKSFLRWPGVIKIRVLDTIPAGLNTSAFLGELETALATPA